MQIVIDIPENAYHNFMILGKKINNVEERQIIQAFENGIPLPKGHGRLIDADALVDTLGAGDRDIYCKAVIEEDAPTVIEADECTCKEREI